jgi:hypothetical protein
MKKILLHTARLIVGMLAISFLMALFIGAAIGASWLFTWIALSTIASYIGFALAFIIVVSVAVGAYYDMGKDIIKWFYSLM